VKPDVADEEIEEKHPVEEVKEPLVIETTLSKYTQDMNTYITNMNAFWEEKQTYTN
jgi:hypothetical protein